MIEGRMENRGSDPLIPQGSVKQKEMTLVWALI